MSYSTSLSHELEHETTQWRSTVQRDTGGPGGLHCNRCQQFRRESRFMHATCGRFVIAQWRRPAAASTSRTHPLSRGAAPTGGPRAPAAAVVHGWGTGTRLLGSACERQGRASAWFRCRDMPRRERVRTAGARRRRAPARLVRTTASRTCAPCALRLHLAPARRRVCYTIVT